MRFWLANPTSDILLKFGNYGFHRRRRNLVRECLFFLVFAPLSFNVLLAAPIEKTENEAVLYETSGRLFNDLLEMFARDSSSSANTRDYGGSMTQILGRDQRFPSATTNDDERSQAWSQLAGKVLKMLRGDATTIVPPMTTVPSFAKRIGQLVPSFLNPFSENNDMPSSTMRSPLAFTFATLPTLPPFSLTTQKPKEDSIFLRISSLFSGDDEKTSKQADGPQIDTGRNFDRFVVRENAEGDNPIMSLIGGKFKERGVEFRDGNLRFVNKQGSKLLGSDLAVHDRSVDIPIDRWLLLANELMNSGVRSN